MTRSLAEAVLSDHCGSRCLPGDHVSADVDLVYITDASASSVLDQLERIACGDRDLVARPERVVLVIDHYVPAPTASAARIHQRMRAFARRTGCLLVDEGEGVCHQVLGEMGLIKPGGLVVGADSHTVTYGARGALATGVGSTDAAVAMASGRLWFQVPESVRLNLAGPLSPGTTGRDVALHLNGLMGNSGAAYQCVELCTADSCLTDDDLAAIANTSVEWGAKAAIVREKAQDILPSNPCYAREWWVDLSEVEPTVALPHSPHRVVPVEEAGNVEIDLCFVGTCAGGTLSDIRQAASVLRGSKVHQGTRLLVTPSSRRIYLQAVREGLIEILVSSGAVVLPPCCGPCCGAVNGIPGDAQSVMSSANRNFRGRMGNARADVFLASSLAVAAAAVAGKITDPREVMLS